MNPPTPIDDLKRLSRTELQRRWREHVGGKSPPKVKLVLLRDLAWRCQQSTPSGLDAPTRSLLKAAIRQSLIPAPGSAPAPGVHPGSRKPRKKRPRPKPELQAGTKLRRTWRGKTYEVEVIEPGKRFNFRRQTYSSLTQIAQEITGAHWSGPRFFGLNRVRSIR